MDGDALGGLVDALYDIEQALEPLTEACGGLPNGFDNLYVRDVLLDKDREWREGRRETEQMALYCAGKS